MPRDIFTERARYRVKLGLLLREAHKQFKSELDQERINATIEQLAAAYTDPVMAKDWIRNNPDRMRDVEAATLEDQLIDKLLETATVVEKVKNYHQLMLHQHEHPDHSHHGHDHHDHEQCDHD